MQPRYDRTTNYVESTLGQQIPTAKVKTADHYLGCRYDPFSPLPATVKIPDGRGKSVVTRDFKTAYSISLTDADTLDIRISPTFPYPVRFNQTGAANVIVDGTTLGNLPAVSPPSASVAAIMGAPVDTAMSTIFGSGLASTTADATNYLGARIVTCGYRLYYTGAAALCNGIVLADNLAARIVTSGQNNTAYTQFQYSVSGVSTNVAVATNSAPAIVVDTTPFGYSTFTSDQVVLRPENGLHGVLKMSKLASDHPYAPWFDTGASVIQSVNGIVQSYDCIYAPSTGLTTTGKKVGAFFWDDAFMETNIRVTGSGQYRLELIMCIEMDLAMTSSLIDLARPSPLYNDAALKRDMIINSMVVPAPFSQPPIDTHMANMSIGGRQRVRRKRNPGPPPPSPASKPRQTGRTARKRRNRQRRAAKKSNK